MQLARKLNETKPNASDASLEVSKKLPAKKDGTNRKRFLAQSFGRSNCI
jgi:hypothetical protein